MIETKDFNIKQNGNDFEVSPVVGKNSGLEWDAFPKARKSFEVLSFYDTSTATFIGFKPDYAIETANYFLVGDRLRIKDTDITGYVTRVPDYKSVFVKWSDEKVKSHLIVGSIIEHLWSSYSTEEQQWEKMKFELSNSTKGNPEELNDTKRKFETGAVRDSNNGKPFVHCLIGYTRQRFGYHMAKNASKYGEFNFLKGIPTEAYLESLDRHLAAYMAGDRSEDHLSSILFGVQGVMLNEEKEGIKADHYFHDKSPAEKLMDYYKDNK